MQKLSIQHKKLIVTNEMLDIFPLNARHDLRTAFIKWWINSRESGGLRLTSTGFKILQKLQYTTYQFSVNKLTTPKNLIIMDKNLECPYYINGLGITSEIVVFGNKEAMTITLYNDFHSFLNTFR